jgi:hypothetical protein
MNHPFDDLWADVDVQLPDGWAFDGLNRGLLSWVATATKYPSRSPRTEIISASSPSPIEAIQKMIIRVKAVI